MSKCLGCSKQIIRDVSLLFNRKSEETRKFDTRRLSRKLVHDTRMVLGMFQSTGRDGQVAPLFPSRSTFLMTSGLVQMPSGHIYRKTVSINPKIK